MRFSGFRGLCAICVAVSMATASHAAITFSLEGSSFSNLVGNTPEFPFGVIFRHAAKLLAAMDLAVRLANFVAWIDQFVAQPLMISLAMIMKQIGVHSTTERLLAEEDHS